jgi:hypothetical protein
MNSLKSSSSDNVITRMNFSVGTRLGTTCITSLKEDTLASVSFWGAKVAKEEERQSYNDAVVVVPKLAHLRYFGAMKISQKNFFVGNWRILKEVPKKCHISRMKMKIMILGFHNSLGTTLVHYITSIVSAVTARGSHPPFPQQQDGKELELDVGKVDIMGMAAPNKDNDNNIIIRSSLLV